MVDSLNEKLSPSLQETVGIARKLIALRDPYTAGHENHVGEFAKAIAAEMGFDEDFQEELLLGGGAICMILAKLLSPYPF